METVLFTNLVLQKTLGVKLQCEEKVNHTQKTHTHKKNISEEIRGRKHCNNITGGTFPFPSGQTFPVSSAAPRHKHLPQQLKEEMSDRYPSETIKNLRA